MADQLPGDAQAGPCAGLTVLDLSTMVSGPMGGQIFGDLGADVIKLEALEGDTNRTVPPHYKGLSAFFAHYNRNKRSVAVDLKSEQGRAIARQIALKADLLIENFRPGVADRLGLGYDTLKKSNPGLVYLSIKGFGEDGPYKDQPAYDQVIQAMTGLMVSQGSVEKPEPIRNPLADKVSAMSGAMAALAALLARERNGGIGQKITVKMMDAWAAFVSQDGMKNNTFLSPDAPKAPTRQLYRVFETRDGHVMGLIIQDNQFRGICAAVNRPGLLTDPRFAKPADRLKHVAELNDELAPAIAAMTTDEFLAAALKHQVPMSRVNTLEQFFEDPQAKHNDTFPTFNDPELGDLRVLGFYASFEKSRIDLRQRAPLLGEHTEEVLRQLGHSDADIERLRDDKIVR